MSYDYGVTEMESTLIKKRKKISPPTHHDNDNSVREMESTLIKKGKKTKSLPPLMVMMITVSQKWKV